MSLKFIQVFGFLLLFSIVYSECPNACSGNGRCTNYAAQFSTGMEQHNKVPAQFKSTYGYSEQISKKDSCTCFTKLGFDGNEEYAYTGADCSLKTCPSGPSFGGVPGANNNHGSIIECSGAGKCDRGSGKCTCFPGFTGFNCGRTTCPNDCSKNGVCKSLKQIAVDVKNSDGSLQFSTELVQYNDAFDAEQSMACICDKNYLGPDCSILQCPSQSDPMGGRGNEYGRPCSGRGQCGSNGKCICYSGYFGTKCERQRVNSF